MAYLTRVYGLGAANIPESIRVYGFGGANLTYFYMSQGSPGILKAFPGDANQGGVGFPPLARSVTIYSRKQKVELSHWELEPATGASPTAWWPHKRAGGYMLPMNM